MRRSTILGAFALCVVCVAHALGTKDDNDITAVSGRTSKDYVRVRQANGSFAIETYAFGKGGPWKGANVDASIDHLGFLDVAHIIAAPLAGQNYVASTNPKTAKLLIMVYWGTTHAPEHASSSAEYELLQINQTDPSLVASVVAENRLRDLDDRLNVMMLGYDSWWEATQGDSRGTALDHRRQDLVDEIEEDRYFVVLMAYDFQLLWKEKKHKLLWETRFSIRQRHHEFDKDLPAMAQYASQYFGQDSHGLIRKEVPLGHVEIGEAKSLGVVPEK